MTDGVHLAGDERTQGGRRMADRAAERYALMLTAGAICGSFMMDLRSGAYTGDEGLARTFHLDPAELKNGVTLKDVIRAFHPDDIPSLGILKPEVIAVAGPYRSEYRVRDQQGRWRWLETNGRIEHDAAGQPMRAFGVVIDIHSSKLNDLRQAALIELGDRFRDSDNTDAILSAAAEIIGRMLEADRTGYARINLDNDQFVVDRDWTNGSVSSIRGVHSLAAFGMLMDRISDGRPLILNDVSQESWLDSDLENLRTLNIGSLINVPLLNHGRLVGLAFANTREVRSWLEEDVAFLRDVADRTWSAISRVDAEHALRLAAQEAKRLAAERTDERNIVWRSSQDLFVLCGFDGYYRAANPAWKEALGYAEDEMHGLRFDALIHPDDAFLGHEAFDQLKAGKSMRVPDIRMLHKDGSFRWYSWFSIPYKNELFYAAGRDVTERRALEEQLRQSQKMEAIGQLTGGIAHDFNNLLHGMLGNLEIMQFRLAQDRCTDVSRYINAAIDAANRSAALTHRLLAFSRQQTLDPKATDINALVTAMEDLITRTTGPAIALHILRSPGLWQTLCDPNQLENALLNLAINARDALPNGGDITIDVGNAVLEENYTRGHQDLQPGEYVRIAVADNGIGMSPEVVRRAIDPFFTTKPIGQGTGLGLSMIYGFVKQSHGHLRLHSVLRKGTTVEIYLPRHAAAGSEAETVEETKPAGKVESIASILLVEDEKIVRTLLTEVMQGLGYTVAAATDAREAMSMLQAMQFDLMVTDIGLPGDMNGRQLANAARAEYRDLPVLFITGFAEQAVFGDGALLPSMEIMTKPFKMNAFTSKIAKMLKCE